MLRGEVNSKTCAFFGRIVAILTNYACLKQIEYEYNFKELERKGKIKRTQPVKLKYLG